MELISDYDCTIQYHPGHANVVADALSRKSHGQLASLRPVHVPLLFSLRGIGISLTHDPHGAILAHLQVRSMFGDLIREAQEQDQQCTKLKEQVQNRLRRDLRICKDGILMHGNLVFVPRNNEAVKTVILDEVHKLAYSMYYGSTKIYHTIRPYYYWYSMKRDITDHVRKCIVC